MPLCYLQFPSILCFTGSYQVSGLPQLLTACCRPVHASAAAAPPQNGPELPGPPPREGLGFRENERDMMRERERESSRDDPRNLYVGFLPPSIQEMGLQALFETIGPVLDCRLIYDRQTGQHKGYGFIKMAEEWMAYEALQRLNTYMVRPVLLTSSGNKCLPVY